MLGEEIETTLWEQTRAARLVVGPWSAALSELAGRPIRLVAPRRTAPDRGRGGAATLLTTASLDALAAELGVDEVDGRRFRMNFGVEGAEPHAEDGWLRRKVALGEAVVVPIGTSAAAP